MPMLVARQPRTLAVDGEWVHVCLTCLQGNPHNLFFPCVDYALEQQSEKRVR